jgi:mobilization protein NikA
VKAPRIGRPPIPKKERKATLLSIRLKPDERRTVERAAKRAGAGLSEWAREALLTAASSASADPFDTQPESPSEPPSQHH